jgi:hypothetical protein
MILLALVFDSPTRSFRRMLLPMDDMDDVYQRNAQHCQKMAEATDHVSDKNEWLRLAQSWLQLIHRRKRADPR